mgnify:CR=1 FL=1
MKLKLTIICLLLGTGLFSSCIREEALNTEADIESVTLAGNVMNRSAEFGDAITTPSGGLIYPVTLYVKKGTDVTRLAPELTLTEGASVVPASGTTLDFTDSQDYIVTSEDGLWKRHYRLSVTTSGITNTKYSFEHVRMGGGGKYHIFYEVDQAEVETFAWASGNPGFALADSREDNPVNFLTYQDDNGYEGKCVTMVTRRAGGLAELVNMPIASGNLFLGQFDVLDALNNALTATKFGLQFEHVPTRLSGYYKYKSGDTFYKLDTSAEDKLSPVPGRKDQGNIYAVFYESTEERPILDATDILSEDNEQVISTAVINQDDMPETDEWTYFEIPFTFRDGKTVDYDKLAQGQYCLTIVFASSIRGDYFEGAPGSTLSIDEVELDYEDAVTEE